MPSNAEKVRPDTKTQRFAVQKKQVIQFRQGRGSIALIRAEIEERRKLIQRDALWQVRRNPNACANITQRAFSSIIACENEVILKKSAIATLFQNERALWIQLEFLLEQSVQDIAKAPLTEKQETADASDANIAAELSKIQEKLDQELAVLKMMEKSFASL
jgi:hypothetical protein